MSGRTGIHGKRWMDGAGLRGDAKCPLGTYPSVPAGKYRLLRVAFEDYRQLVRSAQPSVKTADGLREKRNLCAPEKL
jgi:hypothetical protein